MWCCLAKTDDSVHLVSAFLSIDAFNLLIIFIDNSNNNDINDKLIIITIIVKPPAALQFLTLGFQEGLLKIQNKCNKLTNKTN